MKTRRQAPEFIGTRFVAAARASFLSWLAIVALIAAFCPAAEQRPNVVLILADDPGFNQLGCYGDTPIRTPNLDRLAANGLRFTQAYAGNTVCSPSSVSLFTGRDGRLMQNNSNTVQLREIDVTFTHCRLRYRPLRLKDNPGTLPERTLYWEFGKQAGDPNSGIVGEVFQAARRGKWKAVRYGLDARAALYNIEEDPGESVELSGRFPDVHREFTELFEKHGE